MFYPVSPFIPMDRETNPATETNETPAGAPRITPFVDTVRPHVTAFLERVRAVTQDNETGPTEADANWRFNEDERRMVAEQRRAIGERPQY